MFIKLDIIWYFAYQDSKKPRIKKLDEERNDDRQYISYISIMSVRLIMRDYLIYEIGVLTCGVMNR